MKKFRHIINVVVLTAVSTVALYFFFSEFLFRLPPAASTQAGPIDGMFTFHFWTISFLFSLIMVLMVYSAVAFRRRAGDDTDGPHIHSNTALEIGWTIIPTIFVLGAGFYGFTTLRTVIAEQPNEMVIQVQGQQWSWRFSYPGYERNISSGKLILPEDQPILLEMISVDVLHSFWVPEFRVKQDLLPGRTTLLRITPTEIGSYQLACAEICGRQHAYMTAEVQVISRADFDTWVEEKLNEPLMAEMTPEERGALWYGSEGFACNACHSLDGSVLVGPSWLGVYGRQQQLADGNTITTDEAYIRNAILNPNAQIVNGFTEGLMPQDYEQRFLEKQAEVNANEGIEIDIIADIIAYMQTLTEQP